MSPDLPPAVVLAGPDWDQQARLHHERVAPLALEHLHRRTHGHSHPVWDFLFTYYSFPPGKLLTWVPGILDREGRVRPAAPATGDAPPGSRTWIVPPVPPRLPPLARWVAQLCESVLARPAWFGCFCLHEWAMVYQLPENQVRHPSIPLRQEPGLVDRVIESQPLTCTHYDAFRFFTGPARVRNTHQPTLASREHLEQPGCLHANMDLYKWSAKLWPWIGSNLVGECFELARQARALDMRASPYDNSSLGLPPLPIETAAGREQFAREQAALAERAQSLRPRLAQAARVLAGLAGASRLLTSEGC